MSRYMGSSCIGETLVLYRKQAPFLAVYYWKHIARSLFFYRPFPASPFPDVAPVHSEATTEYRSGKKGARLKAHRMACFTPKGLVDCFTEADSPGLGWYYSKRWPAVAKYRARAIITSL